MPGLQRRDGLVVAALAEHQLREQHVALGADARLNLVRHLSQRALGLLEVAALVPHLAQIEPRLVAHGLGDLAREQRLENLARLDVLAERQIQPAEQQLRLALGVREPLELLRRQKPGDRVEVVVLIEVEQHVAVVQILARRAAAARRDRASTFFAAAGASGSAEQEPREDDRAQLGLLRRPHVIIPSL